MMMAGNWKVQELNEIKRSTFGKRLLINAAIKNRDKYAIIEIIRSSHSWRELDRNGESVLHFAVMQGSNSLIDQQRTVEILEMFLQQKMTANIKNRREETAMHLAVRKKMRKVVLYLLKNGACPNMGDKFSCSMAHFIVQNEYDQQRKHRQQGGFQCYDPKSIKFIEWLLSLGVMKIDIRNRDGDTPLHLAAKYNLIKITRVLLKYTANLNAVNKNKRTVLHVFVDNIVGCSKSTPYPAANYCCQCDIKVLEQLLSRGFSVDTVDALGNTSLHIAANKCRPDVMKVLVMHSKNVNAQNRYGLTVLHMLIELCLYCNNMEDREHYANIAKILISRGANMNAKSNRGIDPVQLALMRTHVPILKVMSDCGADFRVLYEKNNLLHLFAAESNKNVSDKTYNEIINMLVSQGCNINAKNENGRTPLHLAVQSQRCNIVPWLIRYGANIHSRELNNDRLTPLHEAVLKGDFTTVHILVNAGADLNARTNSGRTVLHLSIRTNSSDMVTKLLRLGACLNLVDNFNQLPFHHAIRRLDHGAVYEMLKFGADVNNIDTYRAVSDLPSDSPVLGAVLDHWVKIKAAGLPVYKRYESNFNIADYKHAYNRYLAKVHTLKRRRITDRITLYDFLHMDWNFRCAYINNKNLMEIVVSPILEIRYPEYHVLISANYYDAVARQSLLEPAKRAWYQLTKIFLPDLCVYQILAHLKNVDLRTMVDGAKDRSYRKPLIVPADSLVKIRNCVDAPYE